MLEYLKTHWKLSILFVLILLNFAIYALLYDHKPKEHLLTIALLNIGQGDAMYIEAPNGNQMIIDGGPDATLLRELSKVMPFGDRSIDAIMVTNPDKDHFAGFLDMLKSYSVSLAVEPGTFGSGTLHDALLKELNSSHTPIVLARKGMKIILDDTAQKEVALTILFPDRDVAYWTTNDGSIVSRLTYGSTSVMLTGDTTSRTEGYLVHTIATSTLQSDILKVAHHGSRTSSSVAFIKAVHPMTAIISAGVNNHYGHPHTETLDTFSREHIPVHVTAKEGALVFESDGEVWKQK